MRFITHRTVLFMFVTLFVFISNRCSFMYYFVVLLVIWKICMAATQNKDVHVYFFPGASFAIKYFLYLYRLLQTQKKERWNIFCVDHYCMYVLSIYSSWSWVGTYILVLRYLLPRLWKQHHLLWFLFVWSFYLWFCMLTLH